MFFDIYIYIYLFFNDIRSICNIYIVMIPRPFFVRCGGGTIMSLENVSFFTGLYLQDAYPGAMQNTHTAWVMSLPGADLSNPRSGG